MSSPPVKLSIISAKVNVSPSYALQHWLRSRNTLAFLSLWEQGNNLAFDKKNAEAFIMEAGSSNTTVTLKKWSASTGAIGVIAVPGRYGGTYADPIIAKDFAAWLSPQQRYNVLTLFQRMEQTGKP